MNANEHARKAGELLAGLEAQDRELADVTPERDLELSVSGAYARMNLERRWTLELATAHALTAIAYALQPNGFAVEPSCTWPGAAS